MSQKGRPMESKSELKRKALQGDAISRQAAIAEEALKSAKESMISICKALPSAQPGLDEWCHDCAEYDQERHCCPRFNRVIRETLEEMPMRKRGKWIMHIDDLFPEESTMECDQCHEHQPVDIDDNFCPHCGADMRGEQNEDR